MQRRTQAQRRTETRARLLAAARRTFAGYGYHATSLDRVSENAGCTKGAVYDHFGSKEGLFLALLDQQFATRIEQAQQSDLNRLPRRCRLTASSRSCSSSSSAPPRATPSSAGASHTTARTQVTHSRARRRPTTRRSARSRRQRREHRSAHLRRTRRCGDLDTILASLLRAPP